ncbi:acetyl-CoA carboxylase biotin carboxyl carrier protein [Rhodococcoides yunnanense]|uniref:acetyl-CoA carboxylase biotin carboxyl carrier protein n=1 Tax=Rhodococcoides yunnanense TaxID=278209 RepID=UPI0009337622|nr:biotin/lipoyl-containing protein [Rhodococcus yunnanensis]
MTDNTIPTDVTMRELTALVKEFTASGWASMELDIHGMHLVLGRDGAPATTHGTAAPIPTPSPPPPPAHALAPVPPPARVDPPAAPVGARVSTGDEVAVKSPVVGAFWVSPSPGEAPFVTVGQHVDAGQQLGIVEVMKLMSNVSAPVTGTIVAIEAQNADMVEYDQVLFLIDPDDE